MHTASYPQDTKKLNKKCFSMNYVFIQRNMVSRNNFSPYLSTFDYVPIAYFKRLSFRWELRIELQTDRKNSHGSFVSNTYIYLYDSCFFSFSFSYVLESFANDGRLRRKLSSYLKLQQDFSYAIFRSSFLIAVEQKYAFSKITRIKAFLIRQIFY